MLPSLYPAMSLSSTGGTELLKLPGLTITCTIPSTTTAGAFALIEYCLPPHFGGLAPHWHAHTAEALYVVDGILACMLGDETITATSGKHIFVQPRMIHTFWNPTAAPITVLSYCAPGGAERYYAELAALVAHEPHKLAAVTASLATLGSQYDVFAPSEL